MDRSYWKETVAMLHLPGRCEWATHVLSTDLILSPFEETNLAFAIEATSAEEIIEGVLNAYQVWSSQPACDRILRHFGELIVPAAIRALESGEADVRRGALGALHQANPRIAQDAARSLRAHETNDDVRRDIEWVLNENKEHS